MAVGPLGVHVAVAVVAVAVNSLSYVAVGPFGVQVAVAV
jgi:hypothetical protein